MKTKDVLILGVTGLAAYFFVGKPALKKIDDFWKATEALPEPDKNFWEAASGASSAVNSALVASANPLAAAGKTIADLVGEQTQLAYEKIFRDQQEAYMRQQENLNSQLLAATQRFSETARKNELQAPASKLEKALNPVSLANSPMALQEQSNRGLISFSTTSPLSSVGTKIAGTNLYSFNLIPR